METGVRIEARSQNPRCPTEPPLAVRLLMSPAVDLKHGSTSQPVSRHGPEEECQGSDARSDEHADPDCATDEKLLHVWLPNAEGTEWCRLGLTKEDKNRVELVLV